MVKMSEGIMSLAHRPLHPGKIVKDALFNETGIESMEEAAIILDVDRTILSRLIEGRTSISPEIAYKLGRFLNTSTEMWFHIQCDYDDAA